MSSQDFLIMLTCQLEGSQVEGCDVISGVVKLLIKFSGMQQAGAVVLVAKFVEYLRRA